MLAFPRFCKSLRLRTILKFYRAYYNKKKKVIIIELNTYDIFNKIYIIYNFNFTYLIQGFRDINKANDELVI